MTMPLALRLDQLTTRLISPLAWLLLAFRRRSGKEDGARA